MHSNIGHEILKIGSKMALRIENRLQIVATGWQFATVCACMIKLLIINTTYRLLSVKWFVIFRLICKMEEPDPELKFAEHSDVKVNIFVCHF